MDLLTHLRLLPKGGRASLAAACDTSVGHLNNVAYGLSPCAPALAVLIEKTTGEVTRKDLRPDDWAAIWPELTNDYSGV